MRAASIIALTLLLAACGRNDERVASTNAEAAAGAKLAASTTAQLTPEQLGELGAQINRQPDRANELLAHHGLTRESFEQQIRKITEDPQASRRYAGAWKKVSG